jgi:hypothetical protein
VAIPEQHPARGSFETSPADSGLLLSQLRERKDRALARRLTIQNQITKRELIPREAVRMTAGKIVGAWRGVIQEHSLSTGPVIMAALAIKDPAADSRLQLLLDDETYSTARRINKAVEKWLRSQEITDAE